MIVSPAGCPTECHKFVRPPSSLERTSLPRAPITRRHNRNGVRERLKRRKECRDRVGTKRMSNTDADCRSDSSRPSPPHGQDTRGCHPGARTGKGFHALRRRTPLVGASALHGVSGLSSGSHLGSTLSPGRAVLTRGVSRRSGSVACIRADASPTEVLALSILAPAALPVKLLSRKTFASVLAVGGFARAGEGVLVVGGPQSCRRNAYARRYAQHIAGPPGCGSPRPDVHREPRTNAAVA